MDIPIMTDNSIRAFTYELLRKYGMTTVFGNPGSNELPFLKNFPSDFRYILGLHEGAVMGMADGYAMATGRPTMVNLHAAAGTGNAMGALTNAHCSQSPLVVTAGQQARNLIGVEAMLTNVNSTLLPLPLVKWSFEPAEAADVPRALSQAIQEATLPTPGPTYVSIPHNDWDEDVDANMAHLLRREVVVGAEPSRSQIQAWADLLAQAKSPVLVLGREVDAQNANADAVRLANKLGAPVWMAPSESRCPFPTNHPSFRGVLPISIREVCERLEKYDVILVVGAPVFRYHKDMPGNYLPQGARVLSLTGDTHQAARAPFGDALVSNVKRALACLVDALDLTGRTLPEPIEKPTLPADLPGAIHPENLFHLLNRLAPENVTYVKEATAPATKKAFWSQIQMTQPSSYFFPSAGGLGFGLPAAVGVQLALPDRRVVAIIGDGSANYGITALWSAAQCQVPVIFIILKNGTYGALREFASLLGAEDSPGLDVPGLDFCSIARGYGVDSGTADNAEAFGCLFTQALNQSARPFLIEVSTPFGK
ncbi:benzoylformate decarboxylase [Marinobacter sp. ATCH36]|uniref:benzoylformate decarboxylase n=1 Tax=Marinobacter sp. ATCH36 TaxID=2945106 RepID=UPI002020E3D7|nr:benzoylformate decarboxylase [Marinobacter sp. ATCH36]MCL7942942.1 benzoylformate decarboxylase [Marinobacter sp. ATCH36]